MRKRFAMTKAKRRLMPAEPACGLCAAVSAAAACISRRISGASAKVDFKERSLLGPISGTNFADWPITYEELEPYYTKVDWEIGVSGAPGPFDAPRSKPFPMPPMPIKSSGVLLEKGAKALGLHAQAEPLAILSQAAQWPRRLHQLWLLHGLWLRGRRQVFDRWQR